jgi:tetratricopeptide (TPR) repeat protein
MARRASEIDPKNVPAWQFQVSIQSQMNQPDSALATAQKAIAAGVPKDTLSGTLLAIAAPALKKAQESKSRDDFEAALKAFQTVDQIASSPQSAFYMGVAAYSIAGDALQNVQKIYKNAKEKATTCAEIKVAEDNLAIAQEALPRGGKADPQTAGQLLQSLPQYSDFAAQVKKVLNCK